MIRLSDLTKQYSNPTMKSLGAKPGQVIPNPYVRAFAPIEEAESDHEVSMAQNSLDTIIKNATELKQKIGSMEKNLPGWIQDHITNSENYIEQANSGYHELSEYIDDQGNERAAVGLPQTKEKEEVNENKRYKGNEWGFIVDGNDITGGINVNKTAEWKLTDAGNSIGIGGQFTLMDAGKMRGKVSFPKAGNLAQLAKKMYDIAEKETTWGVKVSEKDILDGLRGYYKAWASVKESVNEDCGCSSKPINENVANTILKQLGGNKFLVMTGAKNLASSGNSLSFKLPRAKGGINFVKITLTNKDLYDIDFGSFRGVRYVVKKSVDDVFAEELPYVFTQYTGLYTSL